MKPNPSRSLRRWTRWVWIYFLHWSGLINRAQRKVAASGAVIVLTLHRVLEDEEAATTRSPIGMVVRKRTFNQLLEYLDKACKVVRLEEAFGPQNGAGKPRFAITFDDGWKDTAAVAFPLTEQYRMPIAVFVCPGLVDKRAPFWPERVTGVWRAGASCRRATRRLRPIRGRPTTRRP